MKEISMKLIFCLALKVTFSVIVNVLATIISKLIFDH